MNREGSTLRPPEVGAVAETARPFPERRRPGARQRYNRLARWIALSDAVSVVLAVVTASLLVGAHGVRLRHYIVAGVLAMVFVFLVFLWSDLYAIYRLTPAEEFRRLVVATTEGFALVILAAFVSQRFVPRQWMVLSWVLAVLFVLGTRRLWHFRIRRVRASGRLQLRTLIVGTNQEAEHLAQVMRKRWLGFEVIGFVTTNDVPLPLGIAEHPVVATASSIRSAVRENEADCVFVASSAIHAEDLRHLARACRLEGVELRVSANLPEILTTRLSIQPVGGVMSLSVHPPELTGVQAAVKRTADLVIAAVTMVLGSPLFLAVALAVKATSKGPVFYRQERVGRHGVPFTMLKFRTMVINADQMLEELRHRNESTGPLFKMKDDPRLTPVGGFLRRWSLDELPQLWNVLTGKMSLIGPRPSLPSEVALYEDWHYDRLVVRPGLTGLWQVSGRSTTTFDDYVRLDLFYIENWSLSYDLFILAKTIPAVFTGEGSY